MAICEDTRANVLLQNLPKAREMAKSRHTIRPRATGSRVWDLASHDEDLGDMAQWEQKESHRFILHSTRTAKGKTSRSFGMLTECRTISSLNHQG
jgi:hypothetical protein